MRWIAVALLASVALLGLAQALLPAVARQRLRDRLAQHGKVEHVEVHAFPAIELLWQSADRVEVSMAGDRTGRIGDLAELLASLGGVGRADATVGVLEVGPLRLTDGSLRKRGDEVVENATLSRADLQAAFPPSFRVRPVGTGGGKLVVRGTASLAGQSVTADFTLAAENGGLVVTPHLPFGRLLTLRLFSDPRVSVESIAVRPQGSGYRLSARARVP